MKMGIRICRFFIWCVLGTGACTANRGNAPPPDSRQTPHRSARQVPLSYQKIATERLGANVEYVVNQNQTLVLCKRLRESDQAALSHILDILVIQPTTSEVLYEDRLPNGEVVWFDETKLKISVIPGIVPGRGAQLTPYYLYDVISREKVLPKKADVN